jgi:hypothetical protein
MPETGAGLAFESTFVVGTSAAFGASAGLSLAGVSFFASVVLAFLSALARRGPKKLVGFFEM